ncbi:MAG: helix-turn-helix domain-containing protein [Bauldia sp.]|nr:MAG: helix-turn-helix domain-containing protein [Bauldia sp.]
MGDNQMTNTTGIDIEAAVSEVTAAKLMGLSVRTLQAWRVRGGGPRFMRFGRAVRYRRRDLIEYMDQRAVNSTTEADAREGGTS